MLTPTILNPALPFDAVGNTPAVSLTRNVPQGVDADILLLGSGDVRHILYTAYHEKGFRGFCAPVGRGRQRLTVHSNQESGYHLV